MRPGPLTMPYDDEVFDMTSIGMVALVAIVAVVLIVMNLAPGAQTQLPDSTLDQPLGRAIDYNTAVSPIKQQFNIDDFDFNYDNRLDFDDYDDVLAGKITCNKDCDLDGDGKLTRLDRDLLDSLIVSLHDYNKNGVLDRRDPVFLREIMLGNEQCTQNKICDLDGDGFVSKTDLTYFAALLFMHDLQR